MKIAQKVKVQVELVNDEPVPGFNSPVDFETNNYRHLMSSAGTMQYDRHRACL
jgi:hypothetical protein